MKPLMKYGQMFLKKMSSTASVNISRKVIADSAFRLCNEFTADFQVEKPKKIEINEGIAFNAVFYNTMLSLDIEIKKLKLGSEVMAVGNRCLF